jgi:hypothetical protein
MIESVEFRLLLMSGRLYLIDEIDDARDGEYIDTYRPKLWFKILSRYFRWSLSVSHFIVERCEVEVFSFFCCWVFFYLFWSNYASITFLRGLYFYEPIFAIYQNLDIESSFSWDSFGTWKEWLDESFSDVSDKGGYTLGFSLIPTKLSFEFSSWWFYDFFSTILYS